MCWYRPKVAQEHYAYAKNHERRVRKFRAELISLTNMAIYWSTGCLSLYVVRFCLRTMLLSKAFKTRPDPRIIPLLKLKVNEWNKSWLKAQLILLPVYHYDRAKKKTHTQSPVPASSNWAKPPDDQAGSGNPPQQTAYDSCRNRWFRPPRHPPPYEKRSRIQSEQGHRRCADFSRRSTRHPSTHWHGPLPPCTDRRCSRYRDPCQYPLQVARWRLIRRSFLAVLEDATYRGRSFGRVLGLSPAEEREWRRRRRRRVGWRHCFGPSGHVEPVKRQK